jgi:hypothetical protein
MELEPGETSFNGFSVTDMVYESTSFACNGCSNICEIIRIKVEGKTLARWGGRCDKWDMQDSAPGVSKEKSKAGASS